MITGQTAVAQGVYPRRGGGRLSGTCIVHTSEGAWTSGVDSLTNLIKTRADYGAYHQACDWEDIAEYYPWEWEAWQDTETNSWAVGIAAACKTTDWAIMPQDIRNAYYKNLGFMAADFVAYMRDVHKITVPLKRITGAQARAKVPGFAAHGDSGVGRTDPGLDFDWAYFFHCTKNALDGVENEDDDMALTNDQIETIARRAAAHVLEAEFKGNDGKPVRLGWLLASFHAMEAERIVKIADAVKKALGK